MHLFSPHSKSVCSRKFPLSCLLLIIVTPFTQDAISSPHFNQDISKYSFINLAAYLGALEESSKGVPLAMPPILLTRDLLLWDAFFKKLKGHSEVLRDRKSVAALMEVIVMLFQYTTDYQVSCIAPVM